uniref:Uncharacterized protein n=1 Tax=Euplotes harpa TaxID=151035 RepID=A0A7S3J0S7_9SPIT
MHDQDFYGESSFKYISLEKHDSQFELFSQFNGSSQVTANQEVEIYEERESTSQEFSEELSLEQELSLIRSDELFQPLSPFYAQASNQAQNQEPTEEAELNQGNNEITKNPSTDVEIRIEHLNSEEEPETPQSIPDKKRGGKQKKHPNIRAKNQDRIDVVMKKLLRNAVYIQKDLISELMVAAKLKLKNRERENLLAMCSWIHNYLSSPEFESILRDKEDFILTFFCLCKKALKQSFNQIIQT